MIVKEQFRPITITLESEDELYILYHLLCMDFRATPQSWFDTGARIDGRSLDIGLVEVVRERMMRELEETVDKNYTEMIPGGLSRPA